MTKQEIIQKILSLTNDYTEKELKKMAVRHLSILLGMVENP